MSPGSAVDKFVETRVQPEFRQVVAAIRSLMKECAPDAQEVISYGIPMYARNKPIAWINPSAAGVTLGFREGSRFEDRYQLLRGTGKHAKHVRLTNLADVDATALKYYINQAVKLDNP
ncbi:MAG: DUF1801 domain-containing protein [Candidatus Dormibacteraceae bacterium]